MKINKEKLIKYIRDNFVNVKIGNGNFIYTGIFTKDMTFSVYTSNHDYNIRITSTNTDIEYIESKLFKITQDTYNELMKFADENTVPETQEFYKQICDEE